MTNESKDTLGESLNEISKQMKKASEKYNKETNEWWNSLSQEDRERAFYAVVQRIHKAELVDKRSYRGALYGIFGFGPEMYATAMDAGYMSVHNALFDGAELMEMTQAEGFEVVDSTGAAVSWPNVENLTFTVDEGKVVVEINKGNPYV